MGKIVHLTTVHHPFDTRIFHKECKTLSQAGFDVTLLLTQHDDLKELDEKKAYFNIVPLKRRNNRLLRIVLGNIDAYKKAKELNADIYHFHDPELIFVGILLKSKKNKVIYDVHEDYETSIRQKKYLPKLLRIIFSKLYRGIEKKCAQKFEICLAEKYYSEKFNDGVCILNYPMIKKPIVKNDITNSNNHSQIKERNNLIYTGNVTEDRGAMIHAELPNYDSNINITFVGKCDTKIADNIFRKAGSNKDRVSIIGINRYINRDEIDSYYKEEGWLAGLAIFPETEHYKRKELTKFFEYMSVGLPIICSNFSTWSEFVNKHKCGLSVDPNNPKEIIKAINYLKENPEEARRMGLNGQKAVREELNWVKEGIKLVNWYEKLLLEMA